MPEFFFYWHLRNQREFRNYPILSKQKELPQTHKTNDEFCGSLFL
jgi:hypothetical protein